MSALFWRRQTFNKSSNNITIIYSFEVPVSKVNNESSSTQVGNEREKAIRFVKIVSGWFLKCRLIKMIILQNYQLATPSQNFSKKVQKNIANELNFVQPVDWPNLHQIQGGVDCCFWLEYKQSSFWTPLVPQEVLNNARYSFQISNKSATRINVWKLHLTNNCKRVALMLWLLKV